MAPRPTYDSPHVQLGRLMRAALAAGRPFEDAWEAAVRPGKPLVMTTHPDPPADAIRWPTDRNDRVTSQGAIRESKDGWRRAYTGEPPNEHEAALAMLAPGLEALEAVAGDRAAAELGDGIEAHEALPSAA